MAGIRAPVYSLLLGTRAGSTRSSQLQFTFVISASGPGNRSLTVAARRAGVCVIWSGDRQGAVLLRAQDLQGDRVIAGLLLRHLRGQTLLILGPLHLALESQQFDIPDLELRHIDRKSVV